jgi:predicted nuclease with RNAse H fold
VALDEGHRVAFVANRATVDDVRDVVARLGPDVVCIDSPPAWARSGRSRTAERELRRVGITAFSTPLDPGSHPFYRWMQVGFAIFSAIADRYPRFCTGDVQGTAVEVFPEASAVLLAGRLRPRSESKVRFRRAVLEQSGVDCSTLRSIDAVDAALAAFTGISALAGDYVAVGQPDEGVIVLPVNGLPDRPLRRDPFEDGTAQAASRSTSMSA